MYIMRGPHSFLMLRSYKVLLTMTFLAGVYDSDNDDAEEFIANDHDPKSQSMRGVSIKPKANEKFDLYLHGARGKDGEKNRLKIGENIKMNFFYTLQVYWGGRNLNGFYQFYKDGKVLMDKTYFQFTDLPDERFDPTFYLGGFNASTNERVVKSKLFTGIISNVEILKIHPEKPPIPEDLLRFIVQKQIIKNVNPWNHDWIKEVSEPPASKRRKVR